MIPVIDDTDVHDPYPVPFSEILPLEVDEDILFGLLPCSWQCEQGWLPLDNGEYVACPECQPEHELGV